MTNKIEQLYVHASQFPDRIARDYADSFAQRRIRHQFHYHTTHQSQQWLNLHKTYSPIPHSEGYRQAYAQCLRSALETVDHDRFDLISLGCGGGEKEVLLHTLITGTRQAAMVHYYPVDVSPALAITAAQKMRRQDPALPIQPMVCDLLHTDDLLSYMPRDDAARLITFFGMIPNFNPAQILPVLHHFLSSGDVLLFSANLAPGDDYALGMETVLPQYDNPETRSWLTGVLRDVGIDDNDGDISVTIEDDMAQSSAALKKISAYFIVRRHITLTINNSTVRWQPGERVQLFFSYRYTTSLVKTYLQQHGIQVLRHWMFSDQQEGLYLCQKAPDDQ